MQSGRLLKRIDEMQQVIFYHGIGSESQGQVSLGLRETASALDEAVTEGPQRLECPCGRALGTGVGRTRMGQHLNLSSQVMGHHRTQRDHLVADQTPGGDQVEASVLLGLSENPLLRAAAMVEEEHAAS